MVSKILLFGEDKIIDDENDSKIQDEFEIHTKFYMICGFKSQKNIQVDNYNRSIRSLFKHFAEDIK